MSEANPILDPIGYRCDGCGRLFRDPYADLSAIRAAGGLSCCPERKPVGLSGRIEELEAKLAKVATRLQHIAANKISDELSVVDWDTHDTFSILDGCILSARTTRAELKGQDDE